MMQVGFTAVADEIRVDAEVDRPGRATWRRQLVLFSVDTCGLLNNALARTAIRLA